MLTWFFNGLGGIHWLLANRRGSLPLEGGQLAMTLWWIFPSLFSHTHTPPPPIFSCTAHAASTWGFVCCGVCPKCASVSWQMFVPWSYVSPHHLRMLDHPHLVWCILANVCPPGEMWVLSWQMWVCPQKRNVCQYKLHILVCIPPKKKCACESSLMGDNLKNNALHNPL